MKNSKDNPAIISDRITVTYGDMDLLCHIFAEILTISRLILIKSRTDVPSIMGYAASMYSGAAVMLCEDKDFDGNIIEKYAPSYIWQIGENIPAGYSEVYGNYGYVLLRAEKEVKYRINENLALLLSTSGSTGSGKFVRISHKNIADNTSAIIQALRIKERDRAMVMLPISYTYGLSLVNTYLNVGAVLLVTEYPVYHSAFWEFAKKHSCSAICGVPYTYELIKKLGFLKNPPVSLRMATQAGGKLAEDTEKYMLDTALKHNFNFAVMYGQTEATARMTCHILNKNPDKLGSAGTVLTGGNIGTVDGELVYKGENVTMGYAVNYTNLADGDKRGEVLYTGDMGFIDRDGFVYITGRKKSISKINGNRISLDELENLIKADCGIAAACTECGDGIHIVLETDCRDDSVTEYVRNYVIKRTGINRRLVKAVMINELPRNKRGKILYEKIE